MNKIILIAWRNLWRNKRRTIITISSMYFAVFFAILTRSFQLGTYNHMIDNMVTQFSGHLQIQEKDYFDNPIIDNSLAYTDTIEQILSNTPEITFFEPRIQSGVLASSGEYSKVAVILGVDYAKNNKIANTDKRIVKYYLDSVFVNKAVEKMPEIMAKNFLKYSNKAYNNRNDLIEDFIADKIDTNLLYSDFFSDIKLPEPKFVKYQNQILVGYKLAQFLELKIGDSLIIMGQGFEGATAVGKYLITGYLNFAADAFNERFIYMPIYASQLLFSSYKLNESDTTFYVNYVSINTKYQAGLENSDYEKVLDLKLKLESEIKKSTVSVIGWQNLNKDLIQGLQMDNVASKIMIAVLYLIIGFGVLGTVMMMVAERKREFGVMLAVGMKRVRLALIVGLEILYMGALAVISGIIITAPIIWYGNKFPIRIRGEKGAAMAEFNIEPVLPFQWFDTYIFSQAGAVFMIIVLIMFYVVFKINKLKVITALRA